MPFQPMITGARFMISAGHYLATQAGHAILEAGGNAVDAGVAAGITLGVVHSDQVQFSGVAPMLIHLHERDEVVAISGLGWWPKAARLEAFADRTDGSLPLGILRTVVPAAPDAWIVALSRFGTMSFGDVAAAAIRCARDGFTMHPLMSHYITQFADQYRLWPQNAAIFLPNDRAPEEGELFVQQDLARTLQFMADEERAVAHKGRLAGLEAARAAFYRGDLAAAMVRFHRENGGWLSAEDLAEYRSEIEAPIMINYKGVDVYSCGPWCQGPVLLQMFSLLEGYDLAALGHNSASYVHCITETMKLCFGDRHALYGDPRFVDVPIARLLTEEYAASRRKLIDPDRAFPGMPLSGIERAGALAQSLGEPQEVQLDGDTSYVCVVDRDGNAFSATPSDTSYESPIIPGLGFCPSSRGSQSWVDPRHPACIAPGKRPRLTPNPAFARRLGEFIMPFGGPGGDLQPQAMLQVFLNRVEFGMNIQEAVEAPRFVTHSFPGSFVPHHYHPARLDLEQPIGEEAGAALAARGHAVQWRPQLSINAAGVCAIVADQKRKILSGGADPRRAARAMGW